MEVSKEEREKIIDCFEKGKVIIRPVIKEAIDRMFNRKSGEESNWNITEYKLTCWGPYKHTYPDNGETIGNDGGFNIDWESVSAGAGSVTFHINSKTKKVCCESEHTSKRFVKELLCKIVDDIDWSDNV